MATDITYCSHAHILFWSW